jgi:hypothetical protein
MRELAAIYFAHRAGSRRSRPVISILASSVNCRFPELALRNAFQARSVQMVRLDAPFGGYRSIEEAPEGLARHPDHALVLAD